MGVHQVAKATRLILILERKLYTCENAEEKVSKAVNSYDFLGGRIMFGFVCVLITHPRCLSFPWFLKNFNIYQ